jgi:hypothetical protein
MDAASKRRLERSTAIYFFESSKCSPMGGIAFFDEFLAEGEIDHGLNGFSGWARMDF